ncbi:MAG: prepilin-type N-terminal cleavage/methylation domain-containing protein [Acidobacteriota bacterium]|nr:prepilin-type N-terminal cleavage/methylation domain-containing protein [Acidobacteriota bacterium]
MTRKENGFTLLELLVVVAIIGILAAIAIPNMLTAIQRSKQRRTMVDMRNLASAWEARNTEAGRYNAAGQANGIQGCDQAVDIDALQNALGPTYIRTFPRVDGWGTPYRAYTDQPWGISTKKAERYAIVSAGHDLVIESDPTTGPFTNFDCDIVYSNGTFLSYPDGVTFGK